jgi:hypothetical protein
MPLESPSHRYARLQVRYLIDGRQALAMESSIYPDMPQYPLNWLEKAVKTRRKKREAEFGNLAAGYLVCI